jgi:hypothetical protein
MIAIALVAAALQVTTVYAFVPVAVARKHHYSSSTKIFLEGMYVAVFDSTVAVAAT